MMEVDPEEEPEEEGEEPEVNDTISPERHDELITLMKQQVRLNRGSLELRSGG